MKKFIKSLITIVVLSTSFFIPVSAEDDYSEVVITDSGQIHTPLTTEELDSWLNWYSRPVTMSVADTTGVSAYYSIKYNNCADSACSSFSIKTMTNSDYTDIEIPWHFTGSKVAYSRLLASSFGVSIPINYTAGDNILVDVSLDVANIYTGTQVNFEFDSLVFQIYDNTDNSGYSWQPSYTFEDGIVHINDTYEKVEVGGDYVRIIVSFSRSYDDAFPTKVLLGVNSIEMTSGSEVVLNQNQMMTQMEDLEVAIANLTELVESQDRDYTEILQAILTAIDEGNTQVTNAIINLMNQEEENHVEILNKLGEMLNVEIEQKNLLQQLVDFFYNDLDSATSEKNEAISKSEQLTEQNNQLEEVEKSVVEDFNTNLDNLDTDLDLLGTNDFVKSANFIATNMTRIVETNTYIQYMITFSLIIGFALVLIGRGLR